MASRIKDLQLVPLTRYEDDRGFLYEIIHATDSFLPKFGQVYLVCSPVRGTIRAFHKHAVLWDYFCVAHGAAKFVLARAPDEAVKKVAGTGQVLQPEALETYVITARNPQLLVVPPDTWHGWMSLEEDTLVVATGSEVYNREKPDEVRVPPDVFGDVWAVKGR